MDSRSRKQQMQCSRKNLFVSTEELRTDQLAQHDGCLRHTANGACAGRHGVITACPQRLLSIAQCGKHAQAKAIAARISAVLNWAVAKGFSTNTQSGNLDPPFETIGSKPQPSPKDTGGPQNTTGPNKGRVRHRTEEPVVQEAERHRQTPQVNPGGRSPAFPAGFVPPKSVRSLVILSCSDQKPAFP